MRVRRGRWDCVCVDMSIHFLLIIYGKCYTRKVMWMPLNLKKYNKKRHLYPLAQFCLLLLRRSDYFKLSLGMTCCSFRSTKSNWEGKKTHRRKSSSAALINIFTSSPHLYMIYFMDFLLSFFEYLPLTASFCPAVGHLQIKTLVWKLAWSMLEFRRVFHTYQRSS